MTAPEPFIPYLTLAEVKEGDTVMLDAGFTCCKAGPALVHKHEDGDLYITCDHIYHMLDGQEDEHGRLIGITKYSPVE